MYAAAKQVLRTAIWILLFAVLACGPGKDELPGLIKKLSDNDDKIRNRAALDIASMGSDGEPAVPALIYLLRDRNRGIRSSAAFALRKIGTPDATAALDSYVKD